MRYKVRLWLAEDMTTDVVCEELNLAKLMNICKETLTKGGKLPKGIQSAVVDDILSVRKKTNTEYAVKVRMNYIYVTTIQQKDEHLLKEAVLNKFLNQNRGRTISIGSMDILKRE